MVLGDVHDISIHSRCRSLVNLRVRLLSVTWVWIFLFFTEQVLVVLCIGHHVALAIWNISHCIVRLNMASFLSLSSRFTFRLKVVARRPSGSIGRDSLLSQISVLVFIMEVLFRLLLRHHIKHLSTAWGVHNLLTLGLVLCILIHLGSLTRLLLLQSSSLSQNELSLIVWLEFFRWLTAKLSAALRIIVVFFFSTHTSRLFYFHPDTLNLFS